MGRQAPVRRGGEAVKTKVTIKVQVSVREDIWDVINTFWGQYEGFGKSAIIKEALRRHWLEIKAKQQHQMAQRLGTANPNN
jgi:hypothetical protein